VRLEDITINELAAYTRTRRTAGRDLVFERSPAGYQFTIPRYSRQESETILVPKYVGSGKGRQQQVKLLNGRNGKCHAWGGLKHVSHAAACGDLGEKSSLPDSRQSVESTTVFNVKTQSLNLGSQVHHLQSSNECNDYSAGDILAFRAQQHSREN
jgi:hypothetical protein